MSKFEYDGFKFQTFEDDIVITSPLGIQIMIPTKAFMTFASVQTATELEKAAENPDALYLLPDGFAQATLFTLGYLNGRRRLPPSPKQ